MVWRRLDRGLISSALLLLNLRPGATKDFVAEWNQVDSARRRADPGRYRASGVLPIDGGELRAGPSDLVIQAGH